MSANASGAVNANANANNNNNNNNNNNANAEEPTKKYSVKYKRNRSTRACEVCHSRKVRCDATLHIPCTNCMTFGSECRFPEPKERKNASQKKKQLKSSQTPEALPHHHHHHLHSHSHEESSPGAPSLKHEPSSSSSAATAAATSSQPVAIPISNTAAKAKLRQHEPLAAISSRSASIDNQKLAKNNISKLSFHGRASTAVLLTTEKDKDTHLQMQDYVPPSLKNSMDQTRVGLDTVQMEILRLRGAFLLPEKALCDDLIHTFFEHIYPVEPIVDRAMFMKQYENGSVSLLLLQSIFLAASRVSSNELIFDGNGSNYLTSATFYQRAKALYEANYEKDPIPIVQSLVLFSRFWEGIDDILGNSFYWTRIAITAAQGFGLHRNMLKTGGNFSPEEIRVCKILWWNLYIRDISCSVAFGRPRVIHLEDCDVPVMAPEDFPPDLARHDAEAFVHMVRLSEIMSIVLHEQYSIRAERSKRHRDELVVQHCDMIMSRWRNSLPPHLQYAPHTHFPLSVNILNLYYYSAVCLVHRSNMVRIQNGQQYPSEGIVFKACRIIADIASKLLKSDDIKYCHALTIPVFFTATLTFICHMDSDNPGIAKMAKMGYEVCSKALHEIGKTYLVAVLIQHGLQRFVEDPKLRERLVSGMSRKNNGTASGTPLYQSAAQTPQAYTPSIVTPAPGAFVDFNTPGANGQTPAMTPAQNGFSQAPTPQMSQTNLQYMMQQRPPHPQATIAEQMPPQQMNQSQQVQPAAQEQGLEFPDLYLFTGSLPQNVPANFDPAELFPQQPAKVENASTAKSDTTSEGFTGEFNLNLPEFDFQSLTNTISLQNLASLNSYLDPEPSGPTGESNIYNFVN